MNKIKHNLIDICNQLQYHVFDTRENITNILPTDLTCNEYHELYKLFYNSLKSYLYGSKLLLRHMLINHIKGVSNHYEIVYGGIKEWECMDWKERKIATDIHYNENDLTVEKINNLNQNAVIKNWLKYRIK